MNVIFGHVICVLFLSRVIRDDGRICLVAVGVCLADLKIGEKHAHIIHPSSIESAVAWDKEGFCSSLVTSALLQMKYANTLLSLNL